MSSKIKAVSVNISEKKGTRKHPVDEIVIDERGIVGDAHAGPGHRQVSLLARESIDRLLSKLTQRERVILTEHYGLEDSTDSKTFEQIGSHLGISKERVRQIEIQALEKLRTQPDIRGE